MSVYKKMHQVQAATRSLAANTEGQTGAARYNYVSGAKLLGVIRPLMDKLGLILTQEVVDIKNEPITYMTRNGEKTEMFTTVHIRFTWVDTDDGSQVVNDFFANGMNAWDKGLGSALTYAERYYLMKTFHIATDEDDVDALVKEEAINSQPSQAVQARRTAAKRPAAKAEAAPAEQPYTPMADKDYWKIVKAYAEGKKTKTGGDYRQTWIEMTHAKPEHIAEFDNHVDDYKASNGINL
jgi:hypothetical protein